MDAEPETNATESAPSARARPRLPERPCPVCGTPVEPLRAAEVVLVDDGFRFLCSARCRASYVAELASAPAEARGPHSSWGSASDSGVGSATTTARKKKTRTRPAEWTGPRVAQLPPPPAPPALALALAGAGLLASFFAASWTLAGIAAVFSVASAALALVLGGHVRESAGLPAYVAAPAAAVAASAAAAVRLFDGGDPRWFLAGAALASVLGHARWWLDATSARTTEALVRSLVQRMPARTHIPLPVENKPRALASSEIDTARVRVGEEIVVREGEVVAVDGEVRAGDAFVLLHPAASAPVRRGPADAVMAGARVVEGAIRVLATHVGDDRALLRPQRFGDGRSADAAPLTRLVLRAEWVGAGALVLGVVVAIALNAGSENLAASLGAVAAVLLATPLLAIRRAADAPYVVGGAAAAERGISFASASALDRAGRTTVVAVSVRGTITEGVPEVAEALSIDAADLVGTITLAASAEREVGESAIARAVVRYAEERKLPLGSVRRVAAVPGRGVRATGPNGEQVVIGARQLLLEDGVSVAIAEGEAARVEQRGLTALFIAVDRRVRALLALRDEPRAGARAAIQRLIDLGVEVVLLSGDSRAALDATAKGLDVDHVRADLTPEERAAEVRRLRDAGGVVAAIAHPAHDPDILAAGDVPVVLTAAGGREGDRAIALSGDDVRDAAGAIFIAHAARREALRASVLAAASGAGLMILGATGMVSPALVAVLAGAVDAFVLPTGARVLRRIELRLPARG